MRDVLCAARREVANREAMSRGRQPVKRVSPPADRRPLIAGRIRRRWAALVAPDGPVLSGSRQRCARPAIRRRATAERAPRGPRQH